MAKVFIIAALICAASAFAPQLPPGAAPRPGGPAPPPGSPGSWGPPPPPGSPGSWGPPPTPGSWGPPGTCLPSPTEITEQKNAAIIKDFYKIAFNDKNVIGAADKYMAQNIIEHNPDGADGIDDFKKTMTFLTTNSPGQVMDIKRVVAQGDLVMVHGKTSWLGKEVAFVDIYRMENGKIAEHWDVIQDMPTNSKNPHAMF